MKRMGQKYIVVFWAACFLLIGMGVVFRVFAAKIQHVPVQLQMPLESFPLEVDGWVGQDVPIPDQILAVAGNDDYLHRVYSRSGRQAPVNLYIAFTARPGKMLGHSPEICYVGAGYILDEHRRTELAMHDDQKIPCMLNLFRKPLPDESVCYVLHYYMLDDQNFATDDKDFRALKWRMPNFSQKSGHFVAQIRFSGPDNKEVRKAAEDLSDDIVHFFRQAAQPIVNNTAND